MAEGDGFVSGRPTVRVDGEEKPEMEGAVRSVTLVMPADGLDALELQLNNWAALPDRDTGFAFGELRLGAALEVFLGADRERPAFKGELTAIEERYGERAPEIVLLGEDALVKLARKRRAKAWEQMSVADIVSAIAGDSGLQGDCDIDVSGTFHQLNESDLAFLRRLGAGHAAAPRLDGTRLSLKREDAPGDPLPLAIGAEIRRLRVVADLARQPGKAVVKGYDVDAGEDLSKDRDRPSGSVDGDAAGAFVTHEEMFPRPRPRSSAEAEAHARGAFDARAREFVSGDLVTGGDPAIRPGRTIEVSGASPRFNGAYKVVSATHRFDSVHGYETFARLARSWVGRG